uniref:Uncharacterized protein n=1 Tax=Zea mays TaxID=4577 RepID=B6SH86_MAIZE|nr:hypothetical protein [Zea mays]
MWYDSNTTLCSAASGAIVISSAAKHTETDVVSKHIGRALCAPPPINCNK